MSSDTALTASEDRLWWISLTLTDMSILLLLLSWIRTEFIVRLFVRDLAQGS